MDNDKNVTKRECPVCGDEKCEHLWVITDLERQIDDLAVACRLFTQSIGQGGYIANLGSTLTNRAMELMRKAQVQPVFYGMIDGPSEKRALTEFTELVRSEPGYAKNERR